MEWGNAKKFVIVLLVIINVVLAALNYRSRQENTMTSAQERAIFEVLAQNGITLYTELPTDALSMQRLEVELPEYGKETLERLFFGSEKTTVITKGNQTVYRNENGVLTMDGAHGLFRKHLQAYILKLEFLYLATACKRELLYKKNIFWNLVSGNLSFTELLNVALVDIGTFMRYNEGSYLLPVFL